MQTLLETVRKEMVRALRTPRPRDFAADADADAAAAAASVAAGLRCN
jgi:hypothetical protein